MRGFRLLAAATVLVPALAFGGVAAYDRARLLGGLATTVRADTDIFCQHALNVFETHQLAADRIAAELAGMDWDAIGRSAALGTTLRDIRGEYPQLQAIWLADATGRVRAATESLPTTPLSVADRDYFQVLQAGTANHSLGALVQGRAQGRINFNIARRLQRPDGRFDGAVITTVYQAYFRDFWTSVAPQPFVAALVRGDRMLMMRMPDIDPATARLPADSEFARNMQGRDHGSLRFVSKLDGIERFFSFRRIGRYDAYIVHGIDVAVALRIWHRHLRISGAVCAAAAGALLGLALIALRRAEREHAVRRLAAEAEKARAAEAARRDAAEAHEAELQHLVTTLAEAERSARASEEQYRALADHSSDAIIRSGIDGVRRYMSPSTFRLLGFRPEELVGQHWTSTVHPDDRLIAEQAIARLLDGAPYVEATIRTLHKNGSVVWIEGQSSLIRDPVTGRAEEIITVARDITARRATEEALAAITAELAQQAVTDALTGLANRRRFDEVLDREWQRAGREELPLSVLILDADRFKLYNDHYGHPMGDQVLRDIATRIQAAIRRPTDVAARYGGEEFAVILPNAAAEGAVQVAEMIRQGIAALGIPHVHGAGGIVTVSVGVASVQAASDTTPAALLAGADRALYAAKAGGRNRTVHAAALAAALQGA